MTRKPHQVSEIQMATFFREHDVEGASATSTDGTYRKRLIRKGGLSSAIYQVTRTYIDGTPASEQKPVIVEQTGSLSLAIYAYNQLK